MINKIKLKPKNQLKKLIDQGLLLKKKKLENLLVHGLKLNHQEYPKILV